MSGLFDSIFGDGKEKTTVTPGQATQLSPLFNFNSSLGNTGATTFANASTGGFATGFGPEAFNPLNRFNNNNQSGLGRVGQMITGLKSNQNPFIQARVNPLKSDIANRRADLSRSISQRGVVGSLGNNELMKFDMNSDRQLGDATALATNEALTSLLQTEGLSNQLNEGQLNLANEYLRRDLAALGLNMDAVRIALSGRQFSSPGSTTTVSGGSDFGSTLSGIGSILTGVGSL